MDCFYCGNCTSHIYHHQAIMGNDIIVRTILLKDGKSLPPGAEIYGKARLSWEKEVATTFDTTPPSPKLWSDYTEEKAISGWYDNCLSQILDPGYVLVLHSCTMCSFLLPESIVLPSQSCFVVGDSSIPHPLRRNFIRETNAFEFM